MMRPYLAIFFLTACGTTVVNEGSVQVQTGPLLDTVAAVQLEPLVDLVAQPLPYLMPTADCPRHTILESAEDTTHERWEGGCTREDGAMVEGDMERFDGPHGAWLAGHDFRIEDNGKLRFGLDGAIELSTGSALWLVDAAVALCGTRNWPCDNGVLGLDLSYTVYPADTFPEDYDTTVSGIVATETATATLDGAWGVDISQCGIEPIWGSLSVYRGMHHAILLDGASDCDGCASLKVQGTTAPKLCGLTP